MRKRIWQLPMMSRNKAGTGDSPSVPAASGNAFPSGIKVLHDHGDSTVDIVFIHGLTGHREKTWTAKGAAAPWPQTLLASELPTSRILTFGYDASVANWKGAASESRIEDHAWNLLASLAECRDDNASERPIIFVCHSLGGLVCKNALIIARQRSEPYLLNILCSTRGIAFLGTPHQGSDLAPWAEKISRYLSVIKQANSNIVAVLKRDSEILASIQDSFHTMLLARSEDMLPPIDITCFYEELPLAVVGLVVPQHSAIIPGYMRIGIRSNHMDMCRFSTKDEAGLKSVCSVLHRWVKKAAATTEHLDNSCTPNNVGESSNRHDETQSPASHFLVPYHRNSDFVGRTEILDQLCQEQPKLDGQFQIRVAIYGLGGIGKTQIALEYMFRLRKECPDMSVFWVHASTTERFRQAYDSIAEECQIPGHNDPKIDVLSLVKKWLENKDHGRWLMVIDNADDAQIFYQSAESTVGDSASKAGHQGGLSRYIPECNHGAIFITTRNKQVGARLTRGKGLVEINKMDGNESSQLLRIRLEDSESDNMLLLASQLEHLPLALAQAAAFIQENTISVDYYLQLLGDSDQNLVSLLGEEFEAAGRDSGTPHAVAATWIITFDQIQRQNVFASELLSFMCCLDRQAIPYEFLAGLSQSQQNLKGEEEVQLTKALGILKAFSLIAEENSRNFNMHRLVQLVTRKWLALKRMTDRVEKQALLIVADKYPESNFRNREICSAYLPHAQAVLALNGTKSKEEDLAKARIFNSVARFFHLKGQWGNAEKFYERVRRIRETVLGPEHHDTLSSMNNLALTYQCQGRWKEAELLYLQVTETMKTVLGPDHPKTLISTGNLASTYLDQGRWREAEPLKVQVMETMKVMLGPDNPHTLDSMSALAATYYEQGRWKEANSLDLQVLETRKMVLGPSHHDTLKSMHNMALAYSDQGRWIEAESLNLQVMDMSKTVLGLDHPDTLTSMSNLASIYWNQGRWTEAESLNLQVLKTRRMVLGPCHPHTLMSMNNLASTYRDQKRWKEAESLNLQVMDTRKTILGPGHLDTLISMGNLASTYLNQGQWKEAESLHVQVLETTKAVLGPDHPYTLTSMDNLASTYHKQGRLKEAESLEVQAMEKKKTVLGPNHPHTLANLHNLAFIWHSQGRVQDAVDLMNQCHQAQLRVLGPEHHYTKSSLQIIQVWREQEPQLEAVVEG
ncbi:hypothetical protein F4861DRAFT_494406 [Xylaria intraflava]|nr:hypothetical protein F4861DRAFT_494406 [Xylaria intraflava]